MEPVVMYSGGKESLLTLKHAVEQGYDPTIIHFKTKKISNYYEKIIKRNAMRVHRTPYYYVIKPDTVDYNAFTSYETGHYGISMDDEGENSFFPRDYGEPIYIGYWKRDNKSMKHAIGFLELYHKDSYRFPLKDMKFNEIIEEWGRFPSEIKHDTISSTLVNFKTWGGRFVGSNES